MRRIINYLKSQPLLTTLGIILLTALFLGDGKQSIIDIVSAGGALSLFIVARFFSVRQRSVPSQLVIGWIFFLSYLIVRTIFSDDVGYSVYTTVRWIEMYLIFHIFYSYSTPEMIRGLPRWIVGFSIISLISAIAYTLIPSLGNTLLLTNLLTPVYGHNHIIDILLFGYPIALIWYFRKPSRMVFLIVVFFIFGVIFSFARAGMALAVLFSFVVMLGQWKQLIKKTRIMAISVLVLFLISGTIMLITPKQNLKQLSGITDAKVLSVVQTPLFEDGRFEYWRQALIAIKERPFFGSGPGTFILLSKRLQDTSLSYSSYAHNSALELASELGFIGILFFCVFITWYIRSTKDYRDVSRKKNNQALNVFIVVIIVQSVYILIDFSLAFFVVQTIFVVCLSISVTLFRKKDTGKGESVLQKYVSVGSICIVLVFYCSEIFCVTGNLKYSSYPQCCFLSSTRASDVLKESINMNDQNLILMTLVLHRENPSVLFALAEHEAKEEHVRDAEVFLQKAVILDSKNTVFFTRYLRFFAEQGRYDDLGKELLQLSKRNLPKKLYQQLDELSVRPSQYYEKYKVLFGKNSGNMYNRYYYYDSLYYFLGLSFIEENPDLTKSFWTLARDIYPDLGHYHVELASLLYHRYDDEVSAKDVLNNCQLISSAAKECQEYLKIPLPLPGSFVEFIR